MEARKAPATASIEMSEISLGGLPIVPDLSIGLDTRDEQRVQAIAAEIRGGEPHIASTEPFGDHVAAGVAQGPWLVIGYAREISLAKLDRDISYQYRLSLLARQGDLVALSGAPHAEYDDYRTRVLGLGQTRAILPPAAPANPLLPLALRCMEDAPTLAALADETRRAGALTIFPHISLGSSWRLAGAIAHATGCEVRVAGAPPTLTRRANDKLWFANLVARVLGSNALPPTLATHGAAVLAHRIRSLARSAQRVVVKVPDSAGAAGNVAIPAAVVAGAPLEFVRDHVLGLLRAIGWQRTFPLLVGVWEAPALSSPSIQMWIPNIEDGLPIIEGIFEQVVEGAAGTFVGSVPADLPDSWRDRLGYEALILARLLQACGYFGRCSFDALLVGSSYDRADLHWIECNGRWGGVSIPMSVVNRVAGKARRPSIVVVQRTDMCFEPTRFSAMLASLGSLAASVARTDQGVILLSPDEIERGCGVQMVAYAATAGDAKAISQQALLVISTPAAR